MAITIKSRSELEKMRGVEYRRVVVPDQGLGGRSLVLPIISSAPTGTWHVRAFTDPKRPAVALEDVWGIGESATAS